MSVNKVILLGRLGQDPELKYTPAGMAVCNFSVATSESWSDKTSGQKQEKTEWHRIVVWGKLAELCGQYLAKGRQAYIEGSLQTRSWDAKDGQKKYTTEIVARTVQFIGAPQNATARTGDRTSADHEQDGGVGSIRPVAGGNGADSSAHFNHGMGEGSDSAFASDEIPF